MNRFAKLTFAAAALTMGALSAAPASAGDIVVKLAGKKPDQISTELERAATRICREEALKATLGGGVDVPVERHPSYRAAQAELEQAQLDLARVEVRAAVPGVASKPPKPGQYVAAGSTAMALVASGNLWIEANFTETDLTYVRVGQPVAIHIDTYPNQAWKGVVDSLSPATGAEFSVIPAQNATGNWIKVVQRIKVNITLEDYDGELPLSAGMSAVVNIDTGRSRTLPWVAQN